MKKLLTKILGITAGIAMAVGIGAGIALSNNRTVKKVEALANGDVFERISNVSDLSDGDEIIFVNQAETYACGTTQNTNNRTPVEIDVEDHTYTYSSSDSVQVFVVKINEDDFGFHTGSGYIYSASSSNNNLKTNSTASSTSPDGTFAWNLTASSNVFDIVNKTNTDYYLAFNGTSYFSQYKKDQIKPYIFKKTSSAPEVDEVFVSLNKSNLVLDLNASLPNSLTATAVTSGSATNGLTAISSNPSVATVSTATPSSGVAFTITAVSVGLTNITVKSSWDENVSASCAVNVVDTTPRIVNFKKANSLSSGQKVLITTVVDGDYYYLPSTSVNSNPTKTACTFNSTYQMITGVDANMAFSVSGDSDGWEFSNAYGDYLKVPSNGTNVRVNSGTHAFTATQVTHGFYLQSTTYTNRFLGIYTGGTEWRAYTSRTADNYKGTDNEYNCDWIDFWVEAKTIQTISGSSSAFTDQTVALSSNATSPAWSIVAGDTTAEGAAVTAAGVVSASGAGSVKVKAVHDDYEDAYFTITFTVRPSEPFITPTKLSTSGYSGQNETVSFTYDHLTGELSVESDDTEVVTVSNLSASAGSGTVRLNFISEGTTDVKFYGGENHLATIGVSVSTSTVTITGLAARDSVQLASNLDLGSTISVVATGSCSSDLTWTSSNGDIATVDEDGVVTGVAQGTVNITVKADDYPSATMTCAVTVAHKKTINLATGYNIANPGSTQSELSTIEVNDYELNILNCHNNNGSYAYMMFATKDLGTDNIISNKTPMPGEISKIVFNIKSNSSGTAVYKATLSDSEVTSKVTSDTYSHTGVGQLIITADPNDDLRYFGISCSTSGSNGQLESIDIYYREPTAKEIISEIDTLSSLSYSGYTKVSEDNYTFTDLLIRYGGFISQDLWEGLDDIQAYGVILSTGNEEIEDLYNAAKNAENTVEAALGAIVNNTTIKRFNSALSLSKTHPAEATTAQKTYMGVDTEETYYIWTLGKGISSEHLTTVYNVVAYIIFDDDIVFFDAAKESAKTLASDLLDNNVYEESDFGGSLKYLADLSVLP